MVRSEKRTRGRMKEGARGDGKRRRGIGGGGQGGETQGQGRRITLTGRRATRL